MDIIDPGAHKIPKLFVFLFIFLLALVCYVDSLGGDFLLDDKPLIVNNAYIKQLKTIPLLFADHAFIFSVVSFEGGHRYYRPMQVLSFALDYFFWRLNPFGYRLTNVFFHSLAAFLLFYLLYRLFSDFSLALLSSVFFTVHPIHTESVAYICGRSELLISVFTLITLVFYLRYLDSRRGINYALSLLGFICALLSREAGFLIYVPLFTLFLGLNSGIKKSNAWFDFIGFSGILLIYVILRFTYLVPVQAFLISGSNPAIDILNFLNILYGYFKLLVLPYPLYILRSLPSIVSYGAVYILGLVLFFILLGIILSLLIRRKSYILVFGAGWFIFTLSYLVRFMYKFGNIVAMEEHWVYLASAGFFIILARLVLMIKKERIIKSACACIIFYFVFFTVAQSKNYKDEIVFSRYNLKYVDPYLSVIPRLNLVSVLLSRGSYAQALEEESAILSIDPDNWMAYVQLGDIYRGMKDFVMAESSYRKALEIDYFCWQANRRLMRLGAETGSGYREDIGPGLPAEEAEVIRLIRSGNFDQAISQLKEKLTASPSP
ncbi:MAG: hypothetical protein JW788_03280, partial [Candidatus Omnitrophica bacterium]|nr:hypothetical protein [Candidatus Omnitrophota bacterium]